MVDATRVVEIVFNAVNNASKDVQELAQDFDGAVNKISEITSPLAEIVDKILQTEAAVVALGTAFGALAVNEATQFQGKIEEIGSLINAQPEDIDKLKSSIQDFAVNSTSNFDQIGQAVYVATSNLGSTSAAMDILEVAEKGANVGATTLETSTALLTRTMNAYGLVTHDSATNTENAERVMAAMFTTVQNGDVNMEALSGSIGKVASTAAAAGVDIETVGASIAALTGAGISADESTTLLNALLKELLNPSKDLSASLGGLSVTTDGLPKVLEALKASTGGSADKMFGLFSSSEAAKAGLILANDSAGKFKTTIDAMGDSVKKFEENYKVGVGGVDDSTQHLANAVTVLLQRVGDPLQDSWQAILDSLVKETQGFTIGLGAGAFDPILSQINIFDGQAAELLAKIGENLPKALEHVDFSGFVASFKELGVDLGDIFVGVDLTTPEGLARAIQFVVDSIESLTRVSSGIIDTWTPFVRALFSGVDAFNSLDDSTKRATGQVLGTAQVFESVKGYVLDATSAVETIAHALEIMTGIKAAEYLKNVITSIQGLSPTTLAAAFAVGALTFAAYENEKAYKELKARNDAVIDAQNSLATSSRELKSRLEDISAQTGVNVTSMDDFNAKVDAGALIMDKASGQWKSATQFFSDISKATGVTVTSQEELNKALEAGTIVFDEATGKYTTYSQTIDGVAKATANAELINGGWVASVDQVAQSLNLASSNGEKLLGTFADHGDAVKNLSAAYEQGVNAIIRYEDGAYQLIDTGARVANKNTEVASSVEDVTKSNVRGSAEWERVMNVMQRAVDSANDFKIKAEEIAEKRYEANITAVVDLHVAEVEAQTARIKAAFDSINIGIQSTGETLASLADTFANSGNLDQAKQDFLKQLVEEESKRRDQEFDLQKELINNQNDYLRAKIDRIRSGQSLVTIESGNLAPELDSLFEKVLSLVQVKATEEGFNLLLGLGND